MPAQIWHVPDAIRTGRLVIRNYVLDDVPAMDVVIPANRAHLETFLPWARHEPVGTARRAELVESFRRGFADRETFTFGVFLFDGSYIGGTGLHARIGPDALEIGYWVSADAEGRGYMTEAAAALTQVGLVFAGAGRIEIRCEPANTRSRRVPERLGFTLVDTRVDTCGGEGREELVEIWEMRADALASTIAGAFPLPGLADAQGKEVPWPT